MFAGSILPDVCVPTWLAVAGILQCGTPDVRISLADSSLNPAGYENSSDEYVCLVNHEDDPVSLNDGDGSGECGSGVTRPTELALEITSPDSDETVESAMVTITGTVTPGSVVRAEIDHDDESDLGGEVARVVSGDGVDHFTVDLQLDPGENHIRVWAEKPGEP